MRVSVSIRHLLGPLVLGAVIVCAGGTTCADGAKPEVKSTSVMGLRVGRTTMMTVYGENLAPKELAVNKPPVTARLLGSRPTDGKLKAKGSRQVTVEVTVPATCPLDTFDLTIVQVDGSKVTIPLPIVMDAAAELTVKKPAGTFETAMQVPGTSVAIVGVLDNDTPDVFRLEAKTGEVWEISLLTGRAGSILDSVLRVRDSKHLSYALSVGEKKKDRHITFRAPADGAYYVEITEAEAKGGAGYDYRLTIVRKH